MGRFGRRNGNRWSYRRALAQNLLKSGAILGAYGAGEDDALSEDTSGLLVVKGINYNVETNARAHHTDKFELTEKHFEDDRWVKPQLVIRRGQAFTISLTFQRPYDIKTDDILLIFDFGDEPNEYKGSSVRFLVSAADLPKQWQAKITRSSGNTVDVEVVSPPNCAVGEWDLQVETVVKAANGETKRHRYLHNEAVIILFNAWCKDDTVYLDDEILREEYVLNDRGRVYQGTAKRIGGKPWNFGQFEDFVLRCVLWLMDNKSQLKPRFRGDPVKTVRRISAIVNACDDNGVLEGNWSGDYTGGIKPTKWAGSVKILHEYWKTKQSVKYGQCWVFSGVTTTVCRALGIPTRSVTNFASAHDSDGSITIDSFWTSDMKPDPTLDGDSVWNFHVWNESWMARPDLPAGMGGWQAFDATPQETSDGIYCAGPAPLNAIKRGLVTCLYDAPFIFAEVNGDRVHWVEQKGKTERSKIIQRNVIGKNISTYKPRALQRSGYNDHRQDITDQYKHKEGSEEERASVWRAASCSKVGAQVYDCESEDVTFSLEDKEEVIYGKQFDIEIKVKNTTKQKRSITMIVNVASAKYTGQRQNEVCHKEFQFTLQPGEETDKKIVIKPADYIGKLVEKFNMKVAVQGSVFETKQLVALEDDFRLCSPDIMFAIKGKAKVGETLECEAYFTNPLEKIPLTGCTLSIEGPGLKKPEEFKCKDVPGGSETRIKFALSPQKPGKREIMASFDCDELPDITGSHELDVAAK